jgi:Fic family protein
VRERGQWEEWIIFMLDGVEKTAKDTVVLVLAIKSLMQQYKDQIRIKLPKIYSQDLLNNLFKYPYTKIEYLQKDLGISRNTSIRYLGALVEEGLISKHKVGRDNFYLNTPLFSLLTQG